MKNLFKSAVAVVLFVFNGAISAQTVSPKVENSLLWEVSGKGLSKPSYLYGTIHMICGKDYFLSEKTKRAFDASSELVLEINFSDPKEINDMQQMAMGKEPLSKRLNPEQLSKLDAILKKTSGMTVQQVDAFSLMTVMSLISMKSFGCNDLKLYEMEFIESAKKKNLKVSGLETIKSQFESFANAYADDEMIAMLEESDFELAKLLVTNYKKENLGGLYKDITSENLMNAKAKKYMLDERNHNWIALLPEMMKKENLFVAVGAAHLAGEEGIIHLLRKEGYTLKPVMN
ncbi:TraB/GumN family protein [Flavobacterium cupreum]|uniref:TraB/GumN family protein n=1 Tax=Flavobacterium cupreum TaxID=2133766 RepID=A0A434A5V6_9FLAO|nr:TraB/GumN family protein [Flavobacterium cupreum]RUT69726.1 TraB/GumN family protein [Flavobacterium cupreum]